MLACDYLLIGGGIAAYSAAKRIRKLKPEARVVMVSEDALPPYDLPPLSKDYLRQEKSDADIVYPALESIKLNPIEIQLNTTVTALDAKAKTATLGNGETIGFGKALLATGGTPIKLPVPGADQTGVFVLRTAADAQAIYAAAKSAQKAVVVGAGFIGVEIAASLTKLGVEVTVIEALDRLMSRSADPVVATAVQKACEARGVRFMLNEMVTGVLGEGQVSGVITASGDETPCDFVVVGIGIRPNVELARAAGLELENGIVVDAAMRTSAADIYAAGDVINYPDPIAGHRLRAEHWGHAEYSGQLAGTNMCAEDGAEPQSALKTYDFMNYAWSDVFDLHIETAGHLAGYDQAVVRGDPDGLSFTSLYLKDGKLVAYCAINVEPVEFAVYRRLIRKGDSLSAKLDGLADVSRPIKTVLEA
jgi:NADPH-dependent 2,4-dienoyl-CoA reductase/sulfur reductase-like enzyme